MLRLRLRQHIPFRTYHRRLPLQLPRHITRAMIPHQRHLYLATHTHDRVVHIFQAVHGRLRGEGGQGDEFLETEHEEAEERCVTGAPRTVRKGGGAGRGGEAIAGDPGADEGVDGGEGGGADGEDAV